MNKGLTNYYRVKRAVITRDVCLAVSILFVFLACLACYTWGRIDGWDAGQFFTEKNIEKAMIEAAAEGHDFRIRNINVQFYPRADKAAVGVAMTEERQ